MSTKIGLAVAGATAAAATAALRYSSKTNDVPVEPAQKADPTMEPDVSGSAFLDHLGAAIRINTTSYDDRELIDMAKLEEFRQFLSDTYPRTHETCDVEVIDESLLYTWEGTDPDADPIVLMAHMDVVPVEEGTESDWSRPPFSGEIDDGYLWGRGAMDDKGPLIATIEAVEHLIGVDFSPTRTVLITFGHDEEIGGEEGAKPVAELVKQRGFTPYLVFDEFGAVADSIPMLSEEPVALVKVAEKGFVNVKLTARGKGGHSSNPPKSTAAGAIGEAVHKLEMNPMKPHVGVLRDMFAALSHRMDPKVRGVLMNLKVTGPVVAKMFAKNPDLDAAIRTTTAVTVISGGVKSNVLPQEASAIVNFRIIPGDTVDDVLAHVRDVVGPDIAVETHGQVAMDPSRFSSIESEAWNAVKRSVEETFPDAAVAPWILIGATDSRYYADFAADIYGFVPFRFDVGNVGIHGTNEKILVSEADRAVSFFCRLIRNAQ